MLRGVVIVPSTIRLSSWVPLFALRRSQCKILQKLGVSESGLPKQSRRSRIRAVGAGFGWFDNSVSVIGAVVFVFARIILFHFTKLPRCYAGAGCSKLSCSKKFQVDLFLWPFRPMLNVTGSRAADAGRRK